MQGPKETESAVLSTDTRPLTPEARLKPGLEPEDGTPVALEGGHVWHLARPRPGIRPRFGPDGSVTYSTVEGRFGPKYSECLDRLERAKTDPEVFGALFPMLAMLIRDRYDVSDEELGALLVLYPDDDSGGVDRLRELMGAASGRALRPKPSADTSEPAPWPTE